MSLLVPLGLLGLLGIVILIIIYILKPNYQQKFVSTTFVWKLSLKYRKKKIPVSKLRNILIIICQVLILTACAAILAQPALVVKEVSEAPEVIAIIDSSASMRAESMEETRYERAVQKTLQLADKTFAENGTVSVIVADSSAEFLSERTTAESKGVLKNRLNALVEDAKDGIIDCSYSTADIDGAIALAEKILKENPKAKIYFYTDTEYTYVPKGIEVVSVAEESEWNAAILNAYTVLVDNYYQFYVDVACYNKDMPLVVNVAIFNANAADASDYKEPIYLDATVVCERDETKRIVFLNDTQYDAMETKAQGVEYVKLSQENWIFSYKSVSVQLYEDDSFTLDNNFEIYDGQREVIKIQYASTQPNPFFSGILMNLKTIYADRYDIQYTEVKQEQEYKTSGFDFYIFEHQAPEVLPTDGINMLVNPDIIPQDSGIESFSYIDIPLGDLYALTAESNHPVLMAGLNAGNIMISSYKKMTLDSSYETLMSFGGYPVLAVRNQGKAKTVVMPFSVHFSNFVITKEFPILMYNIFQYFYPSTVNGNAFEVNEKVQLNAREGELTVSQGNFTQRFTEFPAVLEVDVPGTYTLTQSDVFDNSHLIEEKIYVTIPRTESNICYMGDGLPEPYNEVKETDYYDDLLLYIAALLVAVLFIEWWLQSRDTM